MTSGLASTLFKYGSGSLLAGGEGSLSSDIQNDRIVGDPASLTVEAPIVERRVRALLAIGPSEEYPDSVHASGDSGGTCRIVEGIEIQALG